MTQQGPCLSPVERGREKELSESLGAQSAGPSQHQPHSKASSRLARCCGRRKSITKQSAHQKKQSIKQHQPARSSLSFLRAFGLRWPQRSYAAPLAPLQFRAEHSTLKDRRHSVTHLLQLRLLRGDNVQHHQARLHIPVLQARFQRRELSLARGFSSKVESLGSSSPSLKSQRRETRERSFIFQVPTLFWTLSSLFCVPGGSLAKAAVVRRRRRQWLCAGAA